MAVLCILGHYPAYLELAAELGAEAFSVAEDIWNSWSEERRWQENRAFLLNAVENDWEFVLATAPADARPRSYYWRELEFLIENGYVPEEENSQWRLRRSVT